MTNMHTKALSNAGVSIWLDDLTRTMIESGSLQNEISDRNVVGITTNPSIFAGAIANDPSYEADILSFAQQGLSVDDIITRLTVDDVQAACDVLMPIYLSTDGEDGRVSIEVEPEHAHDTDATVARAKELWQLIDRPNVMIKIPATDAGLPAISQTIANGISVNVTLVFAISRYREVASAYMHGLELALANGHKLSKIHSVASVFVSRFDAAVAEAAVNNDLLEEASLKTGVANAKLVYEASLEIWKTERAKYLLGQGATIQRLLWASTGVKDKRLDPAFYVTELVAANSVNTMPKSTLDAVSKGLDFEADSIAKNSTEAALVLQTITNSGLDYSELSRSLEAEGLSKFEQAWNSLILSVSERVNEKL